jgi:BirA family biotin operon repressor/biotin-[acetyl-CoA-carboxylase] ligase
VIDAGRLRSLAPGSALAASVIALEEVGSTMGEARRRAATREPPFLVVAEAQTRGRGREGRTWHSSPGESLTVTAALALRRPLEAIPAFTLALGVALHRTVAGFLGQEHLSLKWPNDLWWAQRKLAGVLCEHVPGRGPDEVVLAGVGLNVNATVFPEDLEPVATSMRLCAGRAFEREEVLAALCTSVEDAASRYEREGFAPFHSPSVERCRLWGRRCRAGDALGTMETIDERGNLVVRRDDGSYRTVTSGHVELLD